MADPDELERLLRLLREQPAVRAELRRLLADEDGGLGRDAIAEHFAALAQPQVRTEERLDALTERVDALTERVDSLAESVGHPVDHTAWLTDEVGQLRGDMIERRYRERAHAHLSALARRIRLLPLEELDDLLDEATDRQAISREQADQVRMADAVLHGVRHGERVVIVLEASGVADVSDVERAYERAGILGEAGAPAFPVAAGERFTAGARERASALGVWQVVDGGVAEPPAQP